MKRLLVLLMAVNANANSESVPQTEQSADVEKVSFMQKTKNFWSNMYAKVISQSGDTESVDSLEFYAREMKKNINQEYTITYAYTKKSAGPEWLIGKDIVQYKIHEAEMINISWSNQIYRAVFMQTIFFSVMYLVMSILYLDTMLSLARPSDMLPKMTLSQYMSHLATYTVLCGLVYTYHRYSSWSYSKKIHYNKYLSHASYHQYLAYAGFKRFVTCMKIAGATVILFGAVSLLKKKPVSNH